eukprot:scaffold53896_cov39-Phaeocystis_antarctica.AAC.1
MGGNSLELEFALGAVLCRHFENSRFYRPKVRIAYPQISRGCSETPLQTIAAQSGVDWLP